MIAFLDSIRNLSSPSFPHIARRHHTVDEVAEELTVADRDRGAAARHRADLRSGILRLCGCAATGFTRAPPSPPAAATMNPPPPTGREFDGIFLDCSRQRATGETMEKLLKLAEAAKLKEKIEKMFKGDKQTNTENRSVLHVALTLRPARDAVINSDGVNVVPEVGATGKALTNVL
ncbi:hypothetical protein EJB05_53784, partial [Eragrostis curvula]